MATACWTFADLFEAVAIAIPDAPALCRGDVTMNWRQFNDEADVLASFLIVHGVNPHATLGIYAGNLPEHLVGYFAASKASIVAFNVNYRYLANEVYALLDNADAQAVLFDAAYAPILDTVRDRLPQVRCWVAIATPGNAVPGWAHDYHKLVTEPKKDGSRQAHRSSDDLLMIYTGGTTGLPKGVMWRQGDLIAKGNYCADQLSGVGPLQSPQEAGPRAAATPIRPVIVIASPLMHATGLINAIGVLASGGTVVLLAEPGFKAAELWQAVEDHRASQIAIVGQSFAQPMLEALDAEPARWDVSSVRRITSSGVMWSRENKHGLLRHMPDALLIDSFSSSEAMSLGISLTSRAHETETAAFQLGENCAVFDEAHRRIMPGSLEAGRVAVSGYIPVGYYKDPEKTAKTFPTIEGRRWSMPGDWARIEQDGTLTLLGRGSQCINSGGEKIFPEEVEEALKQHPLVRDAAVTGVPDPRFGERIVALVECGGDGAGNDEDVEACLIAHVGQALAAYKVPRRIITVASLERAPNGKLDYAAVKRRATASLNSL